MNARVCAHERVCKSKCVYVHGCVAHAYVCVCVCVCVCACVHARMYVGFCVFVHVFSAVWA